MVGKCSLKNVEQFHINIPQCKIANTLNLPSSTLHSSIKRLKESRDTSLGMGHSWESMLDARDLHWEQAWSCHGNQFMGSGTLIISEHSSLWDPQKQVKSLPCKEKAICEYDPETLLSFLGKSYCKSGNLSVGRQFEILLGINFLSVPALLMVWWIVWWIRLKERL